MSNLLQSYGLRLALAHGFAYQLNSSSGGTLSNEADNCRSALNAALTVLQPGAPRLPDATAWGEPLPDDNADTTVVVEFSDAVFQPPGDSVERFARFLGDWHVQATESRETAAVRGLRARDAADGVDATAEGQAKWATWKPPTLASLRRPRFIMTNHIFASLEQD